MQYLNGASTCSRKTSANKPKGSPLGLPSDKKNLQVETGISSLRHSDPIVVARNRSPLQTLASAPPAEESHRPRPRTHPTKPMCLAEYSPRSARLRRYCHRPRCTRHGHHSSACRVSTVYDC